MSYDTSVFYTLGSYNPWNGEGKAQWTTDKSGKTHRRQTSALENDEVTANMLMDLRPRGNVLYTPDYGLQLVLGILPWGDYAILLPSIGTAALRVSFLPSRHHPREFLSLSPVLFKEKDDLIEAMKGSKDRRAAHRTIKGRRQFTGQAGPNAIKSAGFEHARVFYLSYFRGFRPQALGIPAMFSPVEPKVVVIQFNFFQPAVLAADMEEILLDAAWGIVDFPSRTVEDLSHFTVTKVLNNPGRPRRGLLKEGKNHTVSDPAELAGHLRKLLSSLDPNADLVFLTYDIYNLSRGFCFLGLDDLFPQAAATKAKFRRWQSILDDGTEWETVGALVGYPQLAPLPDPNRARSPYDASYASSSRYDSREPSSAPSSRYWSASPMPNDSRASSVYSNGMTSAYAASDYGTSKRSESMWSDRYGSRSDREWSRGPSVKGEFHDERERSMRSETPLFRPPSPSRSPSRWTSEVPSSSRDWSIAPSSSIGINGEEDVKIPRLKSETPFVPLKHENGFVPLKNENLPDVKPFGAKDEDEKKPFAAGARSTPRVVCALDAQVLYATAGRVWSERYPLHHTAVELGLRENDEGLCAGNEVLDIWSMTQKLLDGPPVLFIKSHIKNDVKVKKAEEEYWKLEEQGLAPPSGPVLPQPTTGGILGPPPPRDPYASKPKRDFYAANLADDDDW